MTAKKKKPNAKRPSTKHKQQPRIKRLRLFGAGGLLLIVIVAAVSYVVLSSSAESGRLVTFHDRGHDRVILTHAGTVRQALQTANIAVDRHDIVEPAIDSTLLRSDSAVIIYRARLVLVIDGAERQKVLTPAQSPNEIALAAGLPAVTSEDKTTLGEGNVAADGASEVLTIERATPVVVEPVKQPTAQALTAAKGAQVFVDSSGVAHRETYYDLPMNIVISACGPGDYTVRYDGAKIDKDGYILVAANYRVYPRCSVVETSLGPGKVYDTGGFALRYPHGFDLATDWTNNDGR